MPVTYDERLRECDRRLHAGRPAMPAYHLLFGNEDQMTCYNYLRIGPSAGVNRDMFDKAWARLSGAQRAEVERRVRE